MTSWGLGEMFEGDSADTCAGKFPLVSMGGRAEGLACADPGARTPIGAIGNFYVCFHLVKLGTKQNKHLFKVTKLHKVVENVQLQQLQPHDR